MATDGVDLLLDQRLEFLECAVAMVSLDREEVSDLRDAEWLVAAEAVAHPPITDLPRDRRGHADQEARREAGL